MNSSSRELSIVIWVDGVPTTACHSNSRSNVHHLEKIRSPHARKHVTQRITSPFRKIIATTLCCLTPNMTRSEEERKALVKRATKAQSDHVTLSVLEAITVATVATC